MTDEWTKEHDYRPYGAPAQPQASSGQNYAWPPPPPPLPPQRRRPLRTLGIVAGCLLLAMLLLGTCVALVMPSTPEGSPAVTVGEQSAVESPATRTAPAPSRKAATAPQGQTRFGEGTFRVGDEVRPGTYRAVVPEDSAGCYWARLRNFEGRGDSIIANDLGNSGQPMRVTILGSDTGFESNGCGTWKRG